jgi:hypothetical protein
MIDSDGGSLTGGGLSRVVLLDCEVTITAKAVTVGLWSEVGRSDRVCCTRSTPRSSPPSGSWWWNSRTSILWSARLAVLLEARWHARHRGAPLRVVIPPWSSLSRAWIKLGMQGMMPPSRD